MLSDHLNKNYQPRTAHSDLMLRLLPFFFPPLKVIFHLTFGNSYKYDYESG